MREIVQTYQKAGLRCLPTKKTKAPATSKWRNTVVSLDEFEGAYGIGVKCGKVSDGLEVFDFDNHFGNAKEILSEYLNNNEVKKIYQKYKLPIQLTQGGGFHLLIRSEHFEGNQKLASLPRYDEKLKRWKPDCIIETRGDGGYFCADPTPGYKVVRNNIYDVQCISKEEREILISTAKSFNKFSEIKKEYQEEKDRPGDLYNSDGLSINEAKETLKQAGWKELSKYFWCREGKKEGISATFGKVANNVFYVFTSNGHPFEPNTAYTPFQIVALLKYKGDFKEFAKVLFEKYNVNYKKKHQQKKETKLNLDDILNKAYIDLDIEVAKPPVIMKIIERGSMEFRYQRLFTLSNFSALTGKGKSKKTYLASLFLASAVKNGTIQDKFCSYLPEKKRGVLSFDTEQSYYDAWITAKRINKLIGKKCENYGAFGLREFNYLERCNIIEYALEKFKNNIGYVLIDGVADLSKGINNEDEAARVGQLLMKWSKVYNCHIQVIIHQNKENNYATGHLGSEIIKKAEAIISVEKIKASPRKSIVQCINIRGVQDFEDFGIFINADGLPEIDTENNISL